MPCTQIFNSFFLSENCCYLDLNNKTTFGRYWHSKKVEFKNYVWDKLTSTPYRFQTRVHGALHSRLKFHHILMIFLPEKALCHRRIFWQECFPYTYSQEVSLVGQSRRNWPKNDCKLWMRQLWHPLPKTPERLSCGCKELLWNHHEIKPWWPEIW